MDHHFKVGASGRFIGFDDKYYKDGAPMAFIFPAFATWTKRRPRKIMCVASVTKGGLAEMIGPEE